MTFTEAVAYCAANQNRRGLIPVVAPLNRAGQRAWARTVGLTVHVGELEDASNDCGEWVVLRRREGGPRLLASAIAAHWEVIQ